ncbi:hypothetical protein TL16_g03405 [Triparma laevis f. inornata]|uniref:ER lumen protein retaining receptor n=1 Tax=Triparma laevis f. inornata TaxID=1714386 RepID=A0A9W7A397_9STRA|nr:hypothetical protein TL16_g03405 [Triparma laevis f. inornata]
MSSHITPTNNNHRYNRQTHTSIPPNNTVPNHLGQKTLPPAPYGGYSPSVGNPTHPQGGSFDNSYNSKSHSPGSGGVGSDPLSKFLSSKLGITKPGHQSHAKTWSLYLLLLLTTLLLFSSYDFSVLLTFGSLTRTFSLLLLTHSLITTQSASSISLKTLYCYVGVYVFRLISLTMHHGYLPYDKTGDWLYHFIELGGLACCAGCVFLIMGRFKNSYNAALDTFGNHPPTLPPQYGVVWLIGPCMLLALIVHPQLNDSFISDVSWAFSMYLESCAVLPQLFMFQKSPSVSLTMSNTIIFLTLSRTLDGIFWMNSYHELVTSSGSTVPGIVCLGSQVRNFEDEVQ